jgi:quercetin dioxygenase-like cupin family protein
MAGDKPLIRRAGEETDAAIETMKGASIAVLLGAARDLPNFEIRRFTLEPGGFIRAHSHDVLEHGQLVLEGRMTMRLGDETHEVGPGDSIYIPAGAAHRYENRGDVPVKFVCVIPRKPYGTEWHEE